MAKYLFKIAQNDYPMPDSAYRTAIGRAYYAAFLEARIYASENMNFVCSKTGKDHTNLADFYKNSKDGTIRYIGEYLFKLKKWRTISDYDIPAEFKMPIKEQAKDAITHSMKIFSKLN
ncbi:HEPN domain-containing protein [Methanolapillus africanus]